MKKYLLYLLALGTFAGCEKDYPGPDQTDQANTASSMEMKLDGQDITLGKDKIQALYYADEGESTGALEISGQLADGGRIVFFLYETKSKTINLEQ